MSKHAWTHRSPAGGHPGVVATVAAVFLLCAAVWLASLAGGGSSARASAARPNILFIVTDDQRDGTLTPEIMPYTIARFQNQGTTFSQAFISTPLCCPARSSIFTGRYAHNHQVLTNQDALSLDQNTTLQHYLHADGYRTGIFGKFLNDWVAQSLGTPPDPSQPPRNPQDFDEWSIFDNGAYYPTSPSPTCPAPPQQLGVDCVNTQGTLGPLPAGTYATTHVAQQAEQFIRNADVLNDSQPWFLYVAPTAPHSGAGGTFDKTQVVETKYQGSDTLIPPFTPTAGYNEVDRTDKPPYVQATSADRSHSLAPGTRDSQLRMLKSVDDMVEGIFATMDTYGETSDTLAIFISDNGFLWGEHGLLSKGQPYTESVEVPLLMRFPPGVGVGTDSRFVGNFDLAPTAMAAAGVTPPAGSPAFDGKSLFDPSWSRSHVLTEGWRYCLPSSNPPPPCQTPAATTFPTWASVRTSSYHYIKYYDDPNTASDESFEEYYDLSIDPSELSNVYGGDGIRAPGDPSPPSALLDADRLCSGNGLPGLEPPPCP